MGEGIMFYLWPHGGGGGENCRFYLTLKFFLRGHVLYGNCCTQTIAEKGTVLHFVYFTFEFVVGFVSKYWKNWKSNKYAVVWQWRIARPGTRVFGRVVKAADSRIKRIVHSASLMWAWVRNQRRTSHRTHTLQAPPCAERLQAHFCFFAFSASYKWQCTGTPVNIEATG